MCLANRIEWVENSRPATLGNEGEREKPRVAIGGSAVGVPDGIAGTGVAGRLANVQGEGDGHRVLIVEE